MNSKRPVHHGISEFALWALRETQGQAVLAGRHCTVLSVIANPDKPAGWYFARVKDTETGDERLIDVTTENVQQAAYQRRQAVNAARTRKKQRAWPS